MGNQHPFRPVSTCVLAALIAGATFAATADADARKRGWGLRADRAQQSDERPERRGFFDRRRASTPAAGQTRYDSAAQRTARSAPPREARTERRATVSRTAQSSATPERRGLLARVFSSGNDSSAAARPGSQRALRSVDAPRKPQLAPGQPNARQSAPIINHALIATSSKSQASITVNIARQRAYVHIGGKVAVDTPISTARPGKYTPRGTFRVGERVQQGKISTIYHVSMPYWMRLGSTPYGMHAGYLPGYPASAGCIRMPYSAAQAIFKATGYGTKVRIISG